MVSLPWKEFHEPLPDNYNLCLKRLRGLLHRLKQNPEVLRQYDDIMKDQLEKGVIEVVTDTTSSLNRTHYLPHHAVIQNDKSTTKIHIVYDASARGSGPSLNDCLYTGPKFDQQIFSILLRFRSYKVVLTLDVEKPSLSMKLIEMPCDFFG